MEFSNIDLLKRVKEETSSKKKPVEILILISRILFIAFLVLAFAQPVIKDRESTHNLDDSVLIYLDNSMSMGRSVGTQSNAFDVAYSLANAIVDTYPDNTKFKFIENDYSNSLATNYSKATIKDRLTELDFSVVSRSVEEIQQRLSSMAFDGDVYMISDFQKRESSSLEKISGDTINNYYFVPVNFEISSNLYFDSAYLENSFLLGELKNELKVSVRNDGENAVDDVNLRLFLDNQLSSTALLDLAPKSGKVYSFEIDKDAVGLNKVRITIEDQGASFDNEFYLTLNNIEKVNVFEIRDPTSERYIGELYRDNELFNYESFVTGNIDLNRLTEGDIIILNEVANFSNQLIAGIKEFLQDGGTVVIIPSSNARAGNYTELGLRVSDDSKQRIQLNTPDLTNPFFTGVFEETEERISMAEATTFFRLKNQELSLLDFNNGRSFLSKASTEGDMYFFSCSFDDPMTSFTNHSLFVPVMYKLALGSKANLSRLYYSTNNETVVYPTDGQGASTVVKLRKGTDELTPDQRFAGTNLIMETPKDALVPGHYEIETGEKSLGTIAFNLPKQESELSFYTKEELSVLAQLNHINLIEANDAVAVDKEITEGIQGVGLWKYALMLALLFLFVEVILIRYL